MYVFATEDFRGVWNVQSLSNRKFYQYATCHIAKLTIFPGRSVTSSPYLVYHAVPFIEILMGRKIRTFVTIRLTSLNSGWTDMGDLKTLWHKYRQKLGQDYKHRQSTRHATRATGMIAWGSRICWWATIVSRVLTNPMTLGGERPVTNFFLHQTLFPTFNLPET